jgi:hypothetical protein
MLFRVIEARERRIELRSEIVGSYCPAQFTVTEVGGLSPASLPTNRGAAPHPDDPRE